MVANDRLLSPLVLRKIEAELISGAPVDHIVQVTGVGKSSIYNFKRNLRAFGSIRPTIHVRRGPPPALDSDAREVWPSRSFKTVLTLPRA
jgi:hypothetical protein